MLDKEDADNGILVVIGRIRTIPYVKGVGADIVLLFGYSET